MHYYWLQILKPTRQQICASLFLFHFMETEISSCSVNVPAQASDSNSNYDELFMQHHLLFAQSLKDLKNIRRQLYSAADYFESSYNRDDNNTNKQLAVESVKDYVTNALVSSVDHLGSVAYKVNSFLDDKVNEISETNLRFSCIEQRLRVCREFIDQGGIRQQSLVIETPKYHKRYIIPVQPTLDANNSKTEWNPSLFLEHHFHQSTHATMVKPDTTKLFRKRIPRPPSASSSSGPGNFLFTRAPSNKVLTKRGVSPLGFSLKRSESVANRSISPNSSNNIQRFPSVPQRSSSLSIHPETPKTSKELEQYSNRSKSLIKTLLRYSSPRRMRNKNWFGTITENKRIHHVGAEAQAPSIHLFFLWNSLIYFTNVKRSIYLPHKFLTSQLFILQYMAFVHNILRPAQYSSQTTEPTLFDYVTFGSKE